MTQPVCEQSGVKLATDVLHFDLASIFKRNVITFCKTFNSYRPNNETTMFFSNLVLNSSLLLLCKLCNPHMNSVMCTLYMQYKHYIQEQVGLS